MATAARPLPASGGEREQCRDAAVRDVAWIRACAVIVALHLALLVAALPDYMVSNDSAFHVALARQYAEHGTYFWDTIHYAPAHRPNLQGPALHIGIGILGRLLGGSGDDYIQANALIAVAGWVAAVGTVVFFARRFGGNLAALLAAALFAGSMFTSGSFRVNIPSAWMFVLTPWAIHFFLERRWLIAALVASLACYTHLGGFLTVSLGVVAAALLARRQRDLVRVGLVVAALTSPYWVHFLRSLAWYVGRRGDTALMLDPLVDVASALGLVAALRAPHRNAFLLAWAAAPLAWLVQDPTRFLLQWPLCGTVLGAVALATWLEHRSTRFRAVATATLVVVATIPGLVGEVMWLRARYPRMIDWSELRADADIIRDHHLDGRIVQGFASWIPSAIAVWEDIEAEKGHWIEVRPRVDRADEISVAAKVYVLAIPPHDAVLAAWAQRGWVRVHGGGQWSAVMEFPAPPLLHDAEAALRESWARDAAWIAASCEPNSLGNPFALFISGEVTARREQRRECQRRVTRMQVGALIYSYGLEREQPVAAYEWRRHALWLGWIAALVADESTLDFRSREAHTRMREDMQALHRAALTGEPLVAPLTRMLDRYIGESRERLL